MYLIFKVYYNPPSVNEYHWYLKCLYTQFVIWTVCMNAVITVKSKWLSYFYNMLFWDPYIHYKLYRMLHGVPLFSLPGGIATGGEQLEVPAGAEGSVLRVVGGQTQGCPRHASQDP